MLISSKDPNCYLVAQQDLAGEGLASFPADDVDAMRQTADWARQYLCRPHPSLGREGPVCPFSESSLDMNLFFMTVYRRQPITQEEIFKTVITYREWFRDLEPREGWEAQFKTILILFPDLSIDQATTIVDGTQKILKPEFVEHGLMIGQFHPGPPQEPGLWNPDFRPLNSPIPMLVIRKMVPTDLPFLVKEGRFVASYLKHFGHCIPERLKGMAKAAMESFGLTPPEL